MIPVLLLALSLAVAPADTLTTVRGEVRSELGDVPIPGVTVQLAGSGPIRSAVSDPQGRYGFRGVPAGRVRVRAERLDYEPMELELQVPSGSDVVLDLTLRPRPVALAPIGVDGRAEVRMQDTLANRGSPLELAGAQALGEGAALAEIGMADRVGSPPGQAPVDPSEVLYVRGAPADLKRVLLDGAPVYTPFHLSGLIDPFQPSLLRSATLFLGGAPARYDGGLSYVLDLSTRAGRPGRTRSSGALDALSARVVAEGSAVGSVRYLAGARTTHGLGVQSLFGGSFPYEYREGLLRLDAPLGQGGLSVTAFGNREQVRLGTAESDGIGAGWENAALSGRYQGRVAGADADVVVAVSSFDAVLAAGEAALPLMGAADRARVASDFSQSAGPVRIGYGASWERMALRHTEPRHGAPMVSNPPPRRLSGETAGAYLEGALQASDRVRVRAGLRADGFSGESRARLAPRLAVTWLVADRAMLSAAAGGYHQHIRVFEAAPAPRAGDSAATVPVPVAFAVARASHLTLGLQQEPEAGTRLGVEGFFKTFSGVPAPYGEGAYASGVDLWVRREVGRVQGWLGYSLSWVWSREEGGASDRFAGRQLLNAGINSSLGRGVDLSARVAYGAGLPFSPIPIDPASPEALTGTSTTTYRSALDSSGGAGGIDSGVSTPAESYLRVDLAISRTFTPRLGDVSTRIAPYLKVLNALDRRDGLFYRRGQGDAPLPEPLGGLPLLPVLGFEWTF